MKLVLGITPDGQVTIPRSVMKLLGIRGGGEVRLEAVNGMVVINKLEKRTDNKADELLIRAV